MKIVFKATIVLSTITLSIVVLAYGLGFRMFEMSSNSSMYPTIKQGDLFIVSTNVNHDELKTGDIILIKGTFLNRNYPLTKRILGIPENVIELRNDSLYIDSELYVESYAHYDKSKPNTQINANWEIQKKQLFVLGDNRNNSIDSRYSEFGLVGYNDVIGKIVFFF